MQGSQRYERYNNNNNNRRGSYRNQNYNRDRSRSFERQSRNRRDGRSKVTAGQGQVLKQVQTEIGFKALNVDSMITLHENVQLDKPDNLVGKLNKYSRCLI